MYFSSLCHLFHLYFLSVFLFACSPLGLISFFNPVFMGLSVPPKWMVATVGVGEGGDELKKKCLSMSIPLPALSAIILHDI